MAASTTSKSNSESDSSSESDSTADSFDLLLEAAVSPPDCPELAMRRPQNHARLLRGSQITERFTVDWCVGSGGMGDVYRCLDQETGDLAAVKVIRRVHDHSRFMREASILAALSHAAIVRYLGHGRTQGGTMYIAMEWLDGEDLAKTLNRTRLSIADCITLARRVCEGLAVAHQHGFVHRDIKPSNLFLCSEGFASTKLLDFGVAHRGITTQTATRAGTLLGTVGYMAPEQASGMMTPDPRDDLFSLGCVLFECITGRPAFLGKNAVSVLESVLQVDPPDVGSVRPETPAELSGLVTKLLRKTRKERPADVGVVLRTLQTLDEPLATSKQPSAIAVRADLPRFGVAICVRGEHATEHCLSTESVTCGDAQVSILRSRADLSIVDMTVQAAQCALALHASVPNLTVEVSAFVDNIDGLATQELASRVLVGAQPQHSLSLFLDPVVCALYRAREQPVHTALRRSVFPECLAPTPDQNVIARSAELSVIEAVLEECKNDEVARAILITAPSGFGKSRLCTQFLDRIAADNLDVLLAAPRPDEQTQALSLIAAFVNRARPAFSAFEAALTKLDSCRALPLVLCIDDAQWCDIDSMKVIATELNRFAERPFLVVGFTRSSMTPELREIWQSTGPHVLTLRPLARRAAESYLKQTLPEHEQREEIVASQVALAAGNPRLLCSIAAMNGASQGPTFDVAVMLFAEQLIALSCRERLVLCALSMFAGRLWSCAVQALLPDECNLDGELSALCERRLLVQLPVAHSVLGIEYRFAHPLVQSAAYRCLSLDERVRMQLRAASWVTSAHGAQSRLDAQN